MLTIGLVPAEAAGAFKTHFRSWNHFPAANPDLLARAAYLRQLGLSPKHVLLAHIKWQVDYQPLSQTSQHLEHLEGVLQQELGGGRRLFLKWLRAGPKLAPSAIEQQRRRIQLLVQVSLRVNGSG